MDDSRLRSIAQLKDFLAATPQVRFGAAGGDDLQRYAHIARVLGRFDYTQLGKADKGVVRAYLLHTSGYSRAQLARLIGRWVGNLASGATLAKRTSAPAKPFARKYTAQDIELLVEMDKANADVCGPAIVHLLSRALRVYGDERYSRLASLSVSHLYNLRKSAGYRTRRTSIVKTQSSCNPIGVRKAPACDGKAGYVRIDTVHQGDLDGVKGVYHITCVDQVSQWQVQASVQGISEAYLLPVLELVLCQFPFVIHGFHSDNGSEYINGRVARLLEKLRIEQTKSRARRSNDNALAESKNAAVVRKHMGYSHIAQHYAQPINAFYESVFNPWLNLHRPCLFATESIDSKGKIVKRYLHENVCTPLQKLMELAALARVRLKPGVSLHALHAQALAQTDLAAAQQMQQAKAALFATFSPSARQRKRA